MTIEEVQKAIDLELELVQPLVKRSVWSTPPVVNRTYRQVVQCDVPPIKEKKKQATRKQKRAIITQKMFEQQQALMAMRRKKINDIARDIRFEKIRLENGELEKTKIVPFLFDESNGHYVKPQPKHNWKMPDNSHFEKDENTLVIRTNPLFLKGATIFTNDIQSVVQIAKNYFGCTTLTDPALYYNQKMDY